MSTRMASKRFSSEKSSVLTKEALSDLNLHDFDLLPNWEPTSGKIYTKVRAISARINQNFDGWPSDELKKSYKTFLGKPVFVNHVNDDPRKARGVVVAARFVENSDDKYIEVIQEVDAERFPILARELVSGGLDSVSMGAEARICKCSYCGNEASDMLSMCAHVLGQKGQILGKVNDDGSHEDILVYEECRKISFFELSYVFDPADETAVVSNVLTANKKRGYGETSLPPQVDTLRDEEEDLEGYFIDPPREFQEPDLDKEYPEIVEEEHFDNRRDEEQREDYDMARVSRNSRRERRGRKVRSNDRPPRTLSPAAEESGIDFPALSGFESGDWDSYWDHREERENRTKEPLDPALQYVQDSIYGDPGRPAPDNVVVFDPRQSSRRGRGMSKTRRARRRYAEEFGRNDQGEQEEVFISQTPSAEPLETGEGAADAPNNSQSDRVKTDQNRDTHTNFEARRRRSNRRRSRRHANGVARAYDWDGNEVDVANTWQTAEELARAGYDVEAIGDDTEFGVSREEIQQGIDNIRREVENYDYFEDSYGGGKSYDHPAPRRRSRRRSNRRTARGVDFSRATYDLFNDEESGDSWYDLVDEDHRSYDSDDLDEVAAWLQQDGLLPSDGRPDFYVADPYEDPYGSQRYEDSAALRGFSDDELNSLRERFSSRKPQRRARRRLTAQEGLDWLENSEPGTKVWSWDPRDDEYIEFSKKDNGSWYNQDYRTDLSADELAGNEVPFRRSNRRRMAEQSDDFDLNSRSDIARKVEDEDVFVSETGPETQPKDASRKRRSRKARRRSASRIPSRLIQSRTSKLRGPHKKAEYNGWSNWETWNTALWYGNDPGAYDLAKGAQSPEELRENAPYVVGDEVDFDQVDWNEVYDAFEEDRTASLRRIRVANIRGPKRTAEYNGWSNYETWNAALWYGNDPGAYELAKSARSPEELAENAPYVVGDEIDFDQVDWNEVYEAFEEDRTASRRRRSSKRRRVADANLDLAAPDGRVNVEAPTAGTTDEDAQASQVDKKDFGNNAGDDLADPDLSTDQNWAPGEGKTSNRASQIEGMRLAEAMVEAGLETHDDRWKLAEAYTKLPAAIVRDRIALLSRTASVKTAAQEDKSQRAFKSARKGPGFGKTPSLQKSANKASDDYTLYM